MEDIAQPLYWWIILWADKEVVRKVLCLGNKEEVLKKANQEYASYAQYTELGLTHVEIQLKVQDLGFYTDEELKDATDFQKIQQTKRERA